MRKLRLTRSLSVAAFSGCLLVTVPSLADDWDFHVEPYLMFSSIDGDASIGRISGAPVDVSFGDILENLDLGGMVHIEALNSNGWGMSFDYGFMKLGAELSGERGGIIDADIRQGVFEALVMRRSEMSGSTVDFFAGFRWWDNDVTVSVDPAVLPGAELADINEDWIDLVIGARLTTTLSDKLKLQIRADIGGLGLESDFTSTVSAGVQYKISHSMALDLQYKATWVDYENGRDAGEPGYFAYNTTTHGPLIGLIFNF